MWFLFLNYKKINQILIDQKYPKTTKYTVIDSIFSTAIVDNYRWLEDDRSKETAVWGKAENEVASNYLNKIPNGDQLKARLSALWNYEKAGAFVKVGGYAYFLSL